MKNDGGPAFPSPTSTGWSPIKNGMSLRDWFAGQALVGPVAILTYLRVCSGYTFSEQEGAEAAGRIADAMLKEREKE